MNSNQRANALIVACLIAGAVWYCWPAKPPMTAPLPRPHPVPVTEAQRTLLGQGFIAFLSHLARPPSNDFGVSVARRWRMPLADIATLGEIRWFNGSRLFWKCGFALEAGERPAPAGGCARAHLPAACAWRWARSDSLLIHPSAFQPGNESGARGIRQPILGERSKGAVVGVLRHFLCQVFLPFDHSFPA